MYLLFIRNIDILLTSNTHNIDEETENLAR